MRKSHSIQIEYSTPDGYTCAKKSCTVVALAFALDVSFQEARDYLIDKGLDKNGSLYSYPVWCELFGTNKVIDQRLPVGKTLAKYSKGVYMFHQTRHVFCVKNGVILDRRKKIGKNTIIDYVVDCN